jgi:hypothetical protein
MCLISAKNENKQISCKCTFKLLNWTIHFPNLDHGSSRVPSTFFPVLIIVAKRPWGWNSQLRRQIMVADFPKTPWRSRKLSNIDTPILYGDHKSCWTRTYYYQIRVTVSLRLWHLFPQFLSCWLRGYLDGAFRKNLLKRTVQRKQRWVKSSTNW